MGEAGNKKIYFLSDFHLGAPNATASLIREKKITRFLDEIGPDAGEIFILGDFRILGKLAEITDAGIPVHFFVGNHDMWMKDYFQKELNIPVYFEPTPFELNGKKFLIGHGDGLGPADHGYKFIKKIFRNKICQWLFGILPPFIGMGIAHYFSRKSRAQAGQTEEQFLGNDKEWLIIYCKEVLQKEKFDYFIFGHRHLPLFINLGGNSTYINLGDWISHDSYGVFDGKEMRLEYYVV